MNYHSHPWVSAWDHVNTESTSVIFYKRNLCNVGEVFFFSNYLIGYFCFVFDFDLAPVALVQGRVGLGWNELGWVSFDF